MHGCVIALLPGYFKGEIIIGENLTIV